MKPFELNENDLETIFKGKKPRRGKRFSRFIIGSSCFVLIYLIAFFFVNFQSIRENTSFWYRTEYKNENYASKSATPNAIDPSIKQSDQPSTIIDNHIRIGVIDVDAPISWRIDNEPAAVRKALQSGVIHINGTAMPGDVGNVFITGHSSDLLWNKGEYKNVFALLNRLVVGDIVQIKYQNKEFSYKVSGIKVVGPEDLSVMDNTDEPILTLMTCTPVGTSLRRLIIVAKQTSPKPATTSSANNVKTTSQKQLPKTR